MGQDAKQSSRGFNVGVAPNNTLHHWLSLAAAPVASVFVLLRIRPSTITTISNAIVLLSLYILWSSHRPRLFAALWVGALVLDFADGIVARRTGTSSANGSFYDHFADKVKVALLFLVVGLRYGSTEIWVASWLAATLFLLMSVVNEELGHRSFRLAQGGNVDAPDLDFEKGGMGAPRASAARPTLARRVKNFVGGFVPRNQALRGLYYSLTMVQGNSMVLVVPVAFGALPALWASAWFAFLCFKSLVFITRAQITVNRRLSDSRISWK